MTTYEWVIVAGIERTGTQWVTWSLGHHPQIQNVRHVSYPYFFCTGASLAEMHPTKTEPLVVMLRDRHCSERSRRRLKWDHRMHRNHAAAQMFEDIAYWRGPMQFVSYEGLVEHGRTYFSWVMYQLGLDPEIYPWERFRVDDGNRKYLR